MADPVTYQVPEAMSGTLHLSAHGAVEFRLDKGDVTTDDPELSAVLVQLAAEGKVKAVKTPRRKNGDETTKE
jgi:hypothetical protein